MLMLDGVVPPFLISVWLLAGLLENIFGAWVYHGEKGNFKMSRISKVLPTSLI